MQPLVGVQKMLAGTDTVCGRGSGGEIGPKLESEQFTLEKGLLLKVATNAVGTACIQVCGH